MGEQIDPEELELAKNPTIPGLLKHTFVPIMTTLMASLYIVCDGVFISNCNSATEYAGTIMAAPFATCFASIGFMIGGGGNAYVGRLFGEGNKERAIDVFSMLVEVTLILTVLASLIGAFLLKPFLIKQGASGVLFDQAYEYGLIMLAGSTFLALQYEFQLFMITSGDEIKAFVFTLIAGIVNLGLDAIFMVVLHDGNEGAAIASVIGELVGAALPMIFYVRNKNKDKAMLYFRWTKIEPKVVGDVCFNGVSEMIETVAESILGFLFNYELLRTVGELGVNAYGSLMYVFMIYSLSFVGFNEAVVPMISYQYGAGNKKELGNLARKCIVIVAGMSVLFFAVTELFAELLSDIFAPVESETHLISVHGFRIAGISLLFMGVAMFIPSLYTALSNGLASGVLTLVEVLVLPALFVAVLPDIWGIDGVWRTVYFGWVLSLVICLVAIKALKTDKQITA